MGAEQRTVIPVENITFITTSPFRIDQLRVNGLPQNYYSNRELNRAINEAETTIDKKLGIDLFTEISSYPIFPAVAKALAVIRHLNTVNGNERNSSRRFSDDEMLAVADSTWVIGDRYFNKPKSHPLGSVVGVREVYNHLVASAGYPARNETVLVIFTKRGIKEIYLFNLEIGTIRNDIGDSTRRREVMKILFSGRENVSAGIDFSEGMSNEIFEHYEEMSLTTFEITFPNGIFDNFDQIDPNELLDAIEINKIGERRISSSDKDLIMQVILGTFDPKFSFNDSD